MPVKSKTITRRIRDDTFSSLAGSTAIAVLCTAEPGRARVVSGSNRASRSAQRHERGAGVAGEVEQG